MEHLQHPLDMDQLQRHQFDREGSGPLSSIGELQRHQFDREGSGPLSSIAIGDELNQLGSGRPLKEVDIIRVELQDCQNRIFKLSKTVQSLVQDVNAVAVASQKQVSRGLAQMARCVDMVQQSVQTETAKRQEEINNLSINVSDMLAQSGAKLREEIAALAVELSEVRTERSREHSLSSPSVDRSRNSGSGFAEATCFVRLREEMTALSMELLAIRSDISVEVEAACLAKLRRDLTALADVSAVGKESHAEHDAMCLSRLREDVTALSSELSGMRRERRIDVEPESIVTLQGRSVDISRAIEESCLSKLRLETADQFARFRETQLQPFREEVTVLSTELSASRTESSREICNEVKELLEAVTQEEMLRTESNDKLANELLELRDVVGREEYQTEMVQETFGSFLQEQDCNDLIDFKQTKMLQDIEALHQYAAFSEETEADLIKDVNLVKTQQSYFEKNMMHDLDTVNCRVDAKTNEMQACCTSLSKDVAKMSQAFMKLTHKISSQAARYYPEAENVTDDFLLGKVDSSVLMNSDVWMKRAETSTAFSHSSEGLQTSFESSSHDDDKECVPRNQGLHTINFFSARSTPTLELGNSARNPPRVNTNSVSRISPRGSLKIPRCQSREIRGIPKEPLRPNSPRETLRSVRAPVNGDHTSMQRQGSGNRTDPRYLVSRLSALRESIQNTDKKVIRTPTPS